MSGIVISWGGLPQYGARLLKEFLQSCKEDVIVLGTQPSVPVEGMEKTLGQKIIWISSEQKRITWAELGLLVPQIFVQSGWSVHPFIKLGEEVKSKGGRVIGLADNNFRGDVRQFLGAIKFRIALRKKFDAMMVPGVSGVKLMKFYGMPERVVRAGQYGADPALFFSNSPLTDRSKTFLFVGQFIKRKGVLKLCRAFLKLNEIYPDWKLRLCGSGVLRPLIPDSENIIVDDFVQPEQLAKIFMEVRFLILPSIQENWGLVVHEAVCSGCALLISSKVGSGPDLASKENSVIFRANDEQAIYNAMKEVVEWDGNQYLQAQKISLEKAKKFGPEQFTKSLLELIEVVSRD
jgi:glycosyltransferase involved in cell wall biosynthesis